MPILPSIVSPQNTLPYALVIDDTLKLPTLSSIILFRSCHLCVVVSYTRVVAGNEKPIK